MVLAAAYFLVLLAGAIALALLWLAYQGSLYLWRQWFGTPEQTARNEVKDTLKVIYKGLATLWQ
jgi:hypothetical protein